MKNSWFLGYFVFTFLLFLSCDHGSDDFSIIETSSDFNYYAIEVFDKKLYVAGGEVWKQCDLSISSDGTNWQTEYFTNRAIFDLHASGSTLFAVGTSGYLFSGISELLKKEVASNSLFKGVTKTDIGLIAIAGKDFNKGWIYPIDNNFQILNEYKYDHELTDVKCDSEGNCIVTGYGIIIYSQDNGLTWMRSTQEGDFYNSIAYNSEGIPFVVGYNGSILFSENKGLKWSAIKSAHSPLANNKPFRKIKFYNDAAYIVGDNGTIWKSVDDGQSWVDISINTELDLFDFVIFNDKLFIASEAGHILTLNQ
ncbi:MAG: hypothetical protein ACJA1A_000608 [Saprospiraceae bacterium]|jgi:hypothetical protein